MMEMGKYTGHTRERERSLFRRMNCNFHYAARAQNPELWTDRRQTRYCEHWKKQAEEIREFLVRCNLPLIKYSFDHFFDIDVTDPDNEDIFSQGLYYLIHAITRFDAFRGLKFSTYFMTVVRRGWTEDQAVYLSQQKKDRALGLRFSDRLETVIDYRNDPSLVSEAQEENARRAQALLCAVPRFRDRKVFREYFGFVGDGNGKKPTAIAKEMDMSMQSVFAILNRGLKRMAEHASNRGWNTVADGENPYRKDYWNHPRRKPVIGHESASTSAAPDPIESASAAAPALSPDSPAPSSAS